VDRPSATESFMSTPWPRPRDAAELALDGGRQDPWPEASHHANMGAYLSTFAPCVPTYLYATLLSGVYVMP
jgi:carbon-monoxide dehydrogenase large subunit